MDELSEYGFITQLVQWGIVTANEGRAMLSHRLPLNGNTWMVSVIHPTETHDDGSVWYSERAGSDPKEAALSYVRDDPDDNPGSGLIRKDPEMTLICVVGQQVAPSGKQWKVFLFEAYEEGEGISKMWRVRAFT